MLKVKIQPKSPFLARNFTHRIEWDAQEKSSVIKNYKINVAAETSGE
jgi:hypothetical protein